MPYEVDYSLIIPAYNEVRRIGRTIYEYSRRWQQSGKSFEIIVVANGCNDGTELLIFLLKRFLLEAPIRLLSLPIGNKGLAVLEGFWAARGRVVGFVDADGAISPDEMFKIMSIAEEGKVAIGSKYLAGTRCRKGQSFPRRVASRGWNMLVRGLFGLKVTDTQAGAKAMPVECARAIIDRVCPCGFAFDVSLLWEAKKAGYIIQEVPIEWEHLAGSKFKLVREVPKMFMALLRLLLGISGSARVGQAREIVLTGEPLPLRELLGS